MWIWREKELNVDWQSWTAAAIAILAGVWAGWKILGPIVNEFRKKKKLDAGCGGCGTCGTVKKNETDGTRVP